MLANRETRAGERDISLPLFHLHFASGEGRGQGLAIAIVNGARQGILFRGVIIDR
jgi:hypothetical protein